MRGALETSRTITVSNRMSITPNDWSLDVAIDGYQLESALANGKKDGVMTRASVGW